MKALAALLVVLSVAPARAASIEAPPQVPADPARTSDVPRESARRDVAQADGQGTSRLNWVTWTGIGAAAVAVEVGALAVGLTLPAWREGDVNKARTGDRMLMGAGVLGGVAVALIVVGVLRADGASDVALAPTRGGGLLVLSRSF
jgi:hypothetical protein